jgi:hypothetical protein
VVFDNLPEGYAHIRSIDELHYATKHGFCTLNPEYWVITHTLEGEEVRSVFSESPHNGIDQDGMNKYVEFAYDLWAQMIGVSVDELVANRRGAI